MEEDYNDREGKVGKPKLVVVDHTFGNNKKTRLGTNQDGRLPTTPQWTARRIGPPKSGFKRGGKLHHEQDEKNWNDYLVAIHTPTGVRWNTGSSNVSDFRNSILYFNHE